MPTQRPAAVETNIQPNQLNQAQLGVFTSATKIGPNASFQGLQPAEDGVETGPLNRLATAALVLGLIPSPFTGVVGVVLGMLALRSIAADPGQRGSALARTGIVFGALWTMLGVVLLLTVLLLPPSHR